MANHALALAEAALRARKLDRTLTTALPARPAGESVAATAVARLDETLGGGLPRGQLSEIVGVGSAGRTALLLHLVAAAARRGEIAALVDTFDQFDIASAVAADIDLDRLLWIRGADGAGAWGLRPEACVERALKALNLVLQAGGFGLVAIDLADVPVSALRAIPFTTWLRVQRTIEGSDTACIIVGSQPLGRSAGGLTLTLAARPRWSAFTVSAGTASRRSFSGLDVTVRVVSPRRQVDGRVAIDAHVR